MKTLRHTRTSIAVVLVCVVLIIVALVTSVAMLGETAAIIPILLGAGLPIIGGVLAIAYARQRIFGDPDDKDSESRR